jgi:hypothetical protein
MVDMQPLSDDQDEAAELERDSQKEIVKEALKEWLNDQWAAFGKWTAKGIAAMAFSALAYWWLSTHGWHH